MITFPARTLTSTLSIELAPFDCVRVVSSSSFHICSFHSITRLPPNIRPAESPRTAIITASTDRPSASSRHRVPAALADFFKSSSRPKQFLLPPAGRKLKLWCGQLCACAFKHPAPAPPAAPSGSKTATVTAPNAVFIDTIDAATLRERQHEQMLAVTRRFASAVEPCSSNSPCCGLEESIEALKQQILNLRTVNCDSSFDQVLKNSLLKVSVDTMAITALPLDCWLKERLKNWVQLSGHEGTIVPATNQTLWKKQPSGSSTEAQAYEKIMADSFLAGMTPHYFKEIEHKSESFIEIQDLLSDFPNTSTRAIMDIKIGTRTFLESEVSNCKKRADLYKKMIDIDPNEPTEEERVEEAITKLRYMQFRERESSSASLGFRIEAAQMPGGKLQKSFKKVRTHDQVVETLKGFFGDRVNEVARQLEKRLTKMRAAVEKSDFFRRHEVVGSSILIIFDEEKSGAWMIDFAKSTEVPEELELNHRTPWEVGNHEDGYLVGLDNLIQVLAECHS